MHHLMMNLPIFGTFGVIALLAGPLANLSIVAGAWVLERCVQAGAWVLDKCLYAGARVLDRCLYDGRNNRGYPELRG
jgi:hypothetical protein